jgi:hypothetical protein
MTLLCRAEGDQFVAVMAAWDSGCKAAVGTYLVGLQRPNVQAAVFT